MANRFQDQEGQHLQWLIPFKSGMVRTFATTKVTLTECLKRQWPSCVPTLKRRITLTVQKEVDSWCKWQSDIVTGESTYSPVSNPLQPAVVQEIKPVFESLSSKKLLQGCVNCLTQNQNESVHHAIGIRLGILKFNEGITKMTKSVFSAYGIKYTENMENNSQKWIRTALTVIKIK